MSLAMYCQWQVGTGSADVLRLMLRREHCQNLKLSTRDKDSAGICSAQSSTRSHGPARGPALQGRLVSTCALQSSRSRRPPRMVHPRAVQAEGKWWTPACIRSMCRRQVQCMASYPLCTHQIEAPSRNVELSDARLVPAEADGEPPRRVVRPWCVKAPSKDCRQAGTDL